MTTGDVIIGGYPAAEIFVFQVDYVERTERHGKIVKALPGSMYRVKLGRKRSEIHLLAVSNSTENNEVIPYSGVEVYYESRPWLGNNSPVVKQGEADVIYNLYKNMWAV